MEASALIAHLLEHALEDTLYLVPFLFVTYVLLEVLEHKAGDRAAELVQRAGMAGPALGALLGAVPQCGFSAAGAALYASRAITLGTFFAVVLSTSDEMLPLFIAEQVDPAVMAGIVGTKVLIGMVMGFAVDCVLRLRLRAAMRREAASLAAGASASSPECASHRYEQGAVRHHSSDGSVVRRHPSAHDCHCVEGRGAWKDVLFCACKHTLEVSAIVFLISLALVAVMEIAGEAALSEFLSGNPGIAIFAAGLVGLIPNCGASVVITQLYLDGVLGTGAMMSGLLVSGGVGLLVLFGENHRPKQNLAILAGLYATGVVWGLILEALGVVYLP